jgi:hypothetical protein
LVQLKASQAEQLLVPLYWALVGAERSTMLAVERAGC